MNLSLFGLSQAPRDTSLEYPHAPRAKYSAAGEEYWVTVKNILGWSGEVSCHSFQQGRHSLQCGVGYQQAVTMA